MVEARLKDRTTGEEEKEEVVALPEQHISRPFLELATKWPGNLRGACSKLGAI